MTKDLEKLRDEMAIAADEQWEKENYDGGHDILSFKQGFNAAVTAMNDIAAGEFDGPKALGESIQQLPIFQKLKDEPHIAYGLGYIKAARIYHARSHAALVEARAENERLMNVEYWPERARSAEKERDELRAENLRMRRALRSNLKYLRLNADNLSGDDRLTAKYKLQVLEIREALKPQSETEE